jgi:two-component system copper resistance phosphate regulon response regulator CusR
MRILVVEDSELLATSLRAGLRKLGHGVDLVGDGRKGLAYARANPYDLVVLDRRLPELDGLSVLKELRRGGCAVPVLFLTAMDAVEERVEGLAAGADDYLVKPFAFTELVARVDALSRRRRETGDPVVRVGPLAVHTAARSVTCNGRPLDLSAREYALLAYLLMRRGETVSRIEIEDHLYDESTLPMSNAVAVAVSALRTRLKDAGAGDLIRTRRGLGYVLDGG